MKLNKKNIPFTMVANEVLSRPDLSLKAKGLYAYLFSKPDGWDFSGDRIVNETKDGRKIVYAALKELENNNLLQRNRLPSGRMEYTLQYSSHLSEMVKRDEKPVAQNGQVPKRSSAKTDSISNKE